MNEIDTIDGKRSRNFQKEKEGDARIINVCYFPMISNKIFNICMQMERFTKGNGSI